MKYEVRESLNGQYYFVLKAKNHKIILVSEMYKSKKSCIKGIRSVQKNAGTKRIEYV